MKSLTVDELKKKLARYCAWRERCSTEAEEKLIALGAGKKHIAEVLKWLVEENYLNDERFAIAFASGKFNYNRWGNFRIAGELAKRGIERKLIDKALSSIEPQAYQKTANMLAQKKYSEVKDDNFHSKKQKTAAYLVSKGFETEIAWKAVNTINHEQPESE
ncbi:MAG: regulatory protein RecX [Bacteroidota bacterium]